MTDDAMPPLPWHAAQNQNGVTCMWDAKGFRVRAKGQIAHEIVKRVNCHDELLAALKGMVALEASIDEQQWYASSECPNALKAAKAAILKAEAK